MFPRKQKEKNSALSVPEFTLKLSEQTTKYYNFVNTYNLMFGNMYYGTLKFDLKNLFEW